MSGARQTIFPVLLSGGSGSRLWPLSRQNAPKQLLRLFGEHTLLQQTALRVQDAELFEPLTVIASAEHRSAIAEQLDAIDTGTTIVLEPTPRNTAAAAAIAALIVERSRPGALMLLMPTDHLIGDAPAFRNAVREAAETARRGYLTLFGLKPDSAATGFGYIRVGAGLEPGGRARHVAEFTEKPNRAKAEEYVASGDYLWNSGIFLLPVAELLSELRRLEPDLLEAAAESLDRAARDGDLLRLDPEAFARCRSVSIDHAVMERTERAAVAPADFSWADVGTWSALWSIAERDDLGNVSLGNVLTRKTRDSYVRSEGPLVATLGVEDLIVVATPDAVLVARKDHDQDIREIFERLQGNEPKRT